MLADLQRNTRLGRKQHVKNNGCVQIINMACETRNENKKGKIRNNTQDTSKDDQNEQK